MWDDHEIRNDWGAFDKDRDKTSLNYKIGLGARRAFWYYQRQLWDDLDDLEEKEKDGKDGGCMLDGFTINLPGQEIGLIFVDSRGARSFYADEERPFVSNPQWKMLQDTLGDGGTLAEAKKVIIVHTMPVVLIGTSCGKACPCIVGGEDKMGFGMYPEEQEEYLALIHDWVQMKESREVMVLAGDLHFAMETEVIIPILHLTPGLTLALTGMLPTGERFLRVTRLPTGGHLLHRQQATLPMAILPHEVACIVLFWLRPGCKGDILHASRYPPCHEFWLF